MIGMNLRFTFLHAYSIHFVMYVLNLNVGRCFSVIDIQNDMIDSICIALRLFVDVMWRQTIRIQRQFGFTLRKITIDNV